MSNAVDKMNIDSARNASEFVCICEKDNKDRMLRCLVPGHEARIYQVCYERSKDKLIILSCQDIVEGGQCKGNKYGICFHALAGLIYSARQNKLKISVCKSKSRAENIQSLGGKILKVVSENSKKTAYIVYTPKPDKGEKQVNA